MRIKASLLICFVLMLSCVSLSAQYKGNMDAFSIRGVFPNYIYPFQQEISPSDFSAGVQLEYTRHLSNALNLAIPLNLASAKYPLDGGSGQFRKRLYLGLDALLQLKLFNDNQFLNPSIYAGIGFNAEQLDVFKLNAPLGMVLDLRLSDNLYLSPKLEYRIGFEDNRDALMPGIGFKILLGDPSPKENKDRDGDGIPNEEDLCPDLAGVPELNGCPDRDGDGITDGEDNCPDLPGLRELSGCPDSDADGIPDPTDNCPFEYGPVSNGGCPLRDSDGDGVTDDQDQCPNTPGLASLAGCPDTDSDGITDAQDLCPRVPGSVATRGCPDTDGDSVIDSDDDCPNTPGTVRNNGCPELSEEDRATLDFAAQNIQFETASATLLSSSRTILDRVADILRRNPNFRVSIDGHTDSIGSSIANQQLSEQRAKSCFDYLIAQGISPDRLTFRGYGESQPLADNATREGRELNRRVEFNIQE